MEIAFPARGSANGLITSLDIFLDITKSEWDRGGGVVFLHIRYPSLFDIYCK